MNYFLVLHKPAVGRRKYITDLPCSNNIFYSGSRKNALKFYDKRTAEIVSNYCLEARIIEVEEKNEKRTKNNIHN